MPDYALTLEYDGRPFVGWQRQATGLSVQQVLEAAAGRLEGGAPVAATVAGRTDAGVHAVGQVAAIRLTRDLPPGRLRDALNFHLQPHPVAVLRAAIAPPGWHPRFDATARGYAYRLLDRRARPVLDAGRVWHVPRPLDAAAMAMAAGSLLGRHDFSAFRAAACQANSPVRTLDRLDVVRVGTEVRVIAGARSFLHHQVRNLVGTLVEVGLGRRPADWPRAVLEGRDRGRAGQTAPPDGLVFEWVAYAEALEWC